MTVYFRWLKNYDADIRRVYKEQVLEEIQEIPDENTEGTHFMIGSGRLTPNKVNRLVQGLTLLGLENTVDFFLWKEPADWVTKPTEESSE